MPSRPPARRRFSAVCLLCVGLIASASAPLHAESSNSLLSVSEDGRLLATVNRDNGTVSIVDLASRKVLREIEVGHHPEGVTFLGKTSRIAVSVYGADQVAIAYAQTGKFLSRIDVFDEPYGVVSNRDGSRVYVTLEYPGQVLEIDPESASIKRTFTAGAFPRGIALQESEKRLYVSEYLAATVHAISLDTGEIVDSWTGVSSENLSRQLVVHPSRPKLYMPHVRSRVTVNQGEGSIVPIISVIDRQAGGEGRRRRSIPMDANVGRVVANPWEVALSPDARTLIAVFAGTDDIYLCDVVDDDYKELSIRRMQRIGTNPRAVRFSPAGDEFYVYNTLDFTIAVLDSHTLQRLALIPVCKNPHSEAMLRGKVLFYSALQPMVGRRWISCASCHPDGDADGRTWHNPEGLRNTTALYGMAWTHPLHWSSDRDESQDFEHTIRGPLMQGRGLASGPIYDALGKPNRGLSKDLDALALYSNSHTVPMSPHAKNGLSAAAQRGQKLFASAETGCANCHSGPYYSDSQPVKPYKLHDVGTLQDDPSEKMGPQYDTPTLLGIYRTAPYLHNGRAKTLEEVLTTENKNDRHGKTSQLKPDQIADLVEFLKALPFEDPLPAAKASSLKPVYD